MFSGNKKIWELFQKIGIWRLLLLVMAGVVLLVLSVPGDGNEDQKEHETEIAKDGGELALKAMDQYAKRKEREVEKLLQKVQGIGKVKVMLTLSSSEERIPMQNGQTNEEDVKEADTSGGSRDTSRYETNRENVLVKKEGEEEPYVVQIYSPSVEGVAVVAEGVDSGEKKKEIIEAIQALFRIEAHKIKVMKME